MDALNTKATVADELEFAGWPEEQQAVAKRVLGEPACAYDIGMRVGMDRMRQKVVSMLPRFLDEL